MHVRYPYETSSRLEFCTPHQGEEQFVAGLCNTHLQLQLAFDTAYDLYNANIGCKVCLGAVKQGMLGQYRRYFLPVLRAKFIHCLREYEAFQRGQRVRSWPRTSMGGHPGVLEESNLQEPSVLDRSSSDASVVVAANRRANETGLVAGRTKTVSQAAITPVPPANSRRPAAAPAGI